MSLLEDVFLEDEAGEAQELERVIEGDEYDERPLSPNSDDNEEKDDEAEEDKRRVDPTEAKAKRVVKNPRFILNPARLTGPRGIQVIPDHYKDFKFKGKGHEKEDLDMVLKKLEHWAYRLYPKFGFHDCLKKIEMLGKKRTVMVHLQKIRSDQLISDEAVVQKDSSDEEPEAPVQEDEFDKLLQQQIELARSTPAPGSVKKPGFGTPAVDRSLMMPKAASSPSISDEQRERMLRNRRLAEERKLAKLRNDNAAPLTPKDNNIDVTIEPEVTNVIDEVVVRKLNRSNVIDSSDDEEPIVNRSIAVDVHNTVNDQMVDVEFNTKENSKLNNIEVSETDVIKEVFAQKRNKSNVINSSDEDEPVASDVHGIADYELEDVVLNKVNNLKQKSLEDITKEGIANKRNKSNVIDSSNEDEPVASDVYDLDDDEMEDVVLNKDENRKQKSLGVVSESEITKEGIAQKRNKSNVINSSDEEEPVAVDVHGLDDDEMEDLVLNKENRKQKSLGVISESDITTESVASKRNKSNVIDSPDKEEPVSQSVAVDAQDKVDNETDVELNVRNDSDATSQDMHKVGTEPVNSEVIDKEVVHNHKRSIIIDRLDEESVRDKVDETNDVAVNYKNKDNIMTSADKSSGTTNDTKDSTHLLSDKESDKLNDVNIPENIDTDENLKIVNNKSKLNDDCETNKEHFEIIDEVMDIDFSDDF